MTMILRFAKLGLCGLDDVRNEGSHRLRKTAQWVHFFLPIVTLWRRVMKRIIILILFATVLLGCSSPTPTPFTPSPGGLLRAFRDAGLQMDLVTCDPTDIQCNMSMTMMEEGIKASYPDISYIEFFRTCDHCNYSLLIVFGLEDSVEDATQKVEAEGDNWVLQNDKFLLIIPKSAVYESRAKRYQEVFDAYFNQKTSSQQ